MPLYTPDHFRADRATAHALIAAHPLGLVFSVASADAPPQVSPVPVLVDADAGELGEVRFHLARANPQTGQLLEDERATFVFQASSSYVSPDWYVDTRLPPTFNYEVVVAHGRSSALDDKAVRTLLDDLSRDQERRLDKVPWTSEKMGEDRVRGLMRGIVGFRFTIERLEAKSKLGQNRAPADRAALRKALAAGATPGSRDLAARMEAVDGET